MDQVLSLESAHNYYPPAKIIMEAGRPNIFFLVPSIYDQDMQWAHNKKLDIVKESHVNTCRICNKLQFQ